MLQKLTIYNDKLITDIFKKIYFSDSFVRSNLVENYFIKDDDSLESLSINLYNNPEYVYYIYILNNYQNIFNDYPLDNKILLEYISNKYSNSSIVLRNDDSISINLSNIKFIGQSTPEYNVISYDKTFNKLIVDRIPNGVSFSSGITLFGENNQTLGTISTYNISYDDSYGLHHFEKDGEIQDPYDTPFESNNTYIEGYANNTLEEYVITNYHYELTKNDNKRNSILIRPEYISLIEKEYNKIMKGINKNINILDIPSSTSNSLVE